MQWRLSLTRVEVETDILNKNDLNSQIINHSFSSSLFGDYLSMPISCSSISLSFYEKSSASDSITSYTMLPKVSFFKSGLFKVDSIVLFLRYISTYLTFLLSCLSILFSCFTLLFFNYLVDLYRQRITNNNSMNRAAYMKYLKV